jgi:voltage-gated potassium channel
MQDVAQRWTPARLRRRLFEVIELGRGDDQASRIFDGVIVFLILANIAAFCAETVPELHARYGRWFDAFEALSVVIFTIEYGLRIWTAVELPFLARMPPLQARLRFARKPLQVIDLLAVLPFYLGSIFGLDLRVLRALRLLRFFKLSRYSPALHTLIRVLKNEGRALSGASLLLMAALLFSSTGMYFIEGVEQPDKFGSVPAAAYWAMTTLTTVGYGDVAPVTPLGKLWAMITMLFGLCILALPVAIISSGFAQEVGRRDFVVTWSLMARIPLLADLDATQVAEVLPMLHAQNLPPNVEVIAAGSPGTSMYFVASGGVHLAAPGGDAEYKTGDFFGVVALLENGENIGRFTTTSRSRLLKLYREDFLRLEASNPTIGAHVRKVAAERQAARRQWTAKAVETSA